MFRACCLEPLLRGTHASTVHIAAIHGHEVFCREAQALNPSLVAAVNSDGETPLLAAVCT
jgi:hypothetical protein